MAKPFHHLRPVPKRDDYGTPLEIFTPLDEEFGFTLDVCAVESNAKVKRFFTPIEDGLTQDWGTNVCWMNPPYGKEIPAWMAKATDAARKGATVVCLVPVRSDVGWWHEYAMKGEIRFLRGRPKFAGTPSSCPFPCAVIVFRPEMFLHSPTSPRGRELLSVRPSPFFSQFPPRQAVNDLGQGVPPNNQRRRASSVVRAVTTNVRSAGSPQSDSAQAERTTHEQTHANRRRTAGDPGHDGRDRRPSLTTGSDSGDPSVATAPVSAGAELGGDF